MNTKITSLLLTCLALLSSPVMGEITYLGDRNAGPKPILMPNGSYRALYNSMNNGEVTAIRPGAIIKYGLPTPVRFDGKAYWQIDVTYKNYTVGGSILIGEARALVRDGRVVAWTDRKGGRLVP
jgi:hypothetical protein